MTTMLARIRGLSPLGPIFGKELRATSRRRRTYVLRFLYLGVLLVIMLFFFSVTRELRYATGAAQKAQQLAMMGATFFGVFSFFTLISMALVGPILTATAINSERLHKTLPVLLMTPITSWQIVAGKLCSRLLIALTLIGLSLPVLSVVRLLGGVETRQIVASLSLSVSMVVAAAALGLLLSTMMARAYAVILLSYAAMFMVYWIGPMIAMLFVQMVMSGGRNTMAFMGVYRYLTLVNPFLEMVLVATPAGGAAPFRAFRWEYCAGVHLAMAAVLVVLSALILRRMAKKENEGGSAAGVPVGPALAPAGSGDETAAPRRQGKPALRGDGFGTVSDNPVLWREIRRPLMNKRWQAIAGSSLVGVLLLIIYWCMYAGDVLSDGNAQMVFACVFCGLLTLVACIVSATAIAQEKESDTWTLVLATPMSAARIVRGKLAGLLRRLMWPSVLIAVHFLLFTIGGVINWTTLWVILYLTFTGNIIWVLTGLYLSLRLKTVTFAVILNLCLPAAIYLLAMAVFGIIGGLAYGTEKGLEVVGVYAPYAHMCSAIDSLNRRYSVGANYYRDGLAQYSERSVWVPVYGDVRESEFMVLVFLVGLGYLAASGLVLWRTIASFNRIVGRAKQARKEVLVQPREAEVSLPA